MKILLINDYGAQVGGAETYIVNLKYGLEKHGHIVKIFTSDALPNKEHFYDYSFKAINQKSVFRLFPYIFNLWSFIKLKKVLFEYNPDIVHLHFIFYHTSPSILLLLKNIPTIMTCHSQETVSPVGLKYTNECTHTYLYSCRKCTGFKYYPEILKRIIFRFLSINIDLYIAPSHYYKKYFIKNDLKPIIHLYNGILRKPYVPIINFNQILFVGRLTANKGAMYIVRAMSNILRFLPNTILTIVGTGPEEFNLKNEVKKLNLEKNVKFIGEISNISIAKYYIESSIVVALSDYPDNLPTVCLEAMSIGRPIIASRIGGLKELVRDKLSGYLIEPGNIAEISDKVVFLLKNKKILLEMSKCAREFSNNFDLNNHINKIETIYNSTINNSTLKIKK